MKNIEELHPFNGIKLHSAKYLNNNANNYNDGNNLFEIQIF